MQNVTDAPRSALTIDEMNYLLTEAPSVDVDYGARVLNQDLTVDRDISGFIMGGSSVTSDVAASIHRTCNLNMQLDAGLLPGDLVQPYMTLTDNDRGTSASFNLGVYLLTSPQPDLSLSPATSVYTGYDLIQLLNQPIGDTYEIAAGQDPIAAAAAVIGNLVPWAQVEYDYVDPDNPPLTDAVYSWPLDGTTTTLQVVNGLLGLGSFRPVYVNWNGVFQMHPYVNPFFSPVEWIFDLTSSNNTVDEERSSDQDLFGVPNWWRAVMNNLDATPVEGVTMFTFLDENTPITGLDARGYQVNKVMFLDAVDYPNLIAQAVQQIEIDLLPVETFELRVFPLPLLWHRDIVQYIDEALDQLPNSSGDNRFCMVTNWVLPLDGTEDMSVTLQTISTAIDTIAGGL